MSLHLALRCQCQRDIFSGAVEVNILRLRSIRPKPLHTKHIAVRNKGVRTNQHAPCLKKPDYPKRRSTQ